MGAITKVLPSGDVAVIQEDGSHVLIDPQGNVKADTAAAPGPSLAEKASSFLSKPQNSLPLSPMSLVSGTRTAANAYVAADKKYPTENLLPIVGATAGGIAGAKLPIPFAATALAGAGGRVGEKLRQGVAAMRGNGPELSPEESNSMANKQGVAAALSELGGSTILKGLRLGGRAIAGSDEGVLNNFIDLIRNKLASGASREEVQTLVNKFKDTPVKDTQGMAKPIQEFLGERGGQINPTEISGLSPQQIENLRAGGATDSDLIAFANKTTDAAQTPRKSLKSPMESFNYSENNPLAKFYNDLKNPDFSNYADLKNIQKNVGDFAFNSSDRTAQQRFAGKVYHDIGEKLKQTAEEGGFLNEHNFVQDQGRKYHQRQFFENLLQEKGVRDLIDEGKLNPTVLAKKLDVPDEDIQRLFGSKTDLIKAFKNFSAQLGEADIPGNIRARATTKGGIFGTANVGTVKSALNTPELLQKIADRRGVSGELRQVLPIKFPYPEETGSLVLPLVNRLRGANENR